MPSTGQSSCHGCPTGSYQEVTGQTYCDSCSLGKFSDSLAASSPLTCRNCSGGSYSNATGQSVCALCGAGYFSKSGMSYCERCSPGWVSGIGYDQCIECPAQTYSSSDQTQCIRCDTGYYSLAGSTACIQCDPGYFLNMEVFECQICGNDTYSNELKTICLDCPLNATSPPGSSSVYDCRCPDGYDVKYVAGVYLCDACAVGTYRFGDMADCQPCDAGYYAFSRGMARCKACEPGYYQVDPGMFYCNPCGLDTYQPLYAATDPGQCLQCPLNSFSGFATGNLTDCICESGHGFNYNGSTMQCVSCLPGYHKSVSGNFPCEACEDGYYTDVTATVDCRACETGTYSTGAAMTTCLSCPVGKYSSDMESIRYGCLPCAPGMTTLGTGQKTSNACECKEGNQPSGSSGCRPCLPGYYKAGLNRLDCVACSWGTYLPTYAGTACLNCPNHSTSALATASVSGCLCRTGYERVGGECMACPAGKFKAYDSNTMLCQACPVGYFQPLTAQAQCLPCTAVGLYTTTASGGSTSPEQCLCIDNYGFQSYNSTSQVKVCRPCPSYGYKVGLNDDACTLCPMTDSISKHYYVVNRQCVMACDFGYIPDNVNGSCRPSAPELRTFIHDVSYRNIHIDGVLDAIQGEVSVQYTAGNSFPFLHVTREPYDCQTCCMPLVARGYTGYSVQSVALDCRWANETSNCTCSDWNWGLFQKIIPYDQEQYAFMDIQPSSSGGYNPFSLYINRFPRALNCTPWGQTSLNCSFYLACSFLSLDSGYNLEYSTVFHRFSFSKTVAGMVSVFERVRSDMMQHLSMSVYSFSESPIVAVRFMFTGPEALLTRAQAMTFKLSMGGVDVLPETQVCHHLALVPQCWEGNPWLQQSNVFRVGRDCHSLSSWRSGESMWIFMELPTMAFSSIRVTLLLSNTDPIYTFTGAGVTSYGGFLKACPAVFSAYDTRTLNATLREGLNGTWEGYTPWMRVGGISIQSSMLTVALGMPGITRVEIVMVHVIGETLADLIDNLVDDNRMFSYQGTRHLIISQDFQTYCFSYYPTQCITRTTTVGLVDVLRMADDEGLCEVEMRQWLQDAVKVQPSTSVWAASKACLGRNTSEQSYFAVPVAYEWPASFQHWVEEGGEVITYLSLAVPTDQAAFRDK